MLTRQSAAERGRARAVSRGGLTMTSDSGEARRQPTRALPVFLTPSLALATMLIQAGDVSAMAGPAHTTDAIRGDPSTSRSRMSLADGPKALREAVRAS